MTTTATKITLTFAACLFSTTAVLAQEPIDAPDTSPVEAAPPATTSPPATATPPADAKPPEPKKIPMLESFKKTTFSRTAVVTLREWSGAPPPDAPTPAPSPPAGTPVPPPDTNAPLLDALRKDVALGKWSSVGTFLTEQFKDKPEDAKPAYQYLLDGLGKAAGPQNMPNNGGGGGMPPSFAQTNILSPDDVLQLADQCNFDYDQNTLQKLGSLLSGSLQRGSVLDDILKKWEAGTAKLGGSDPIKRRNVAKILVAAGRRIEAASFLAKPDKAVADKDIETLNLLAVSAEGKFAKDGKPEDLEQAWSITQSALAIADADKKERAQALRRAVELAPKVKTEFGGKWLADSFTSKPELGMEILSGIGTASVQSRMQFNSEPRLVNLELQSRAVEALLKSSPQRAQEWSQTLTLLALNWLAEAKWTQDRDTSVTRGPQINYDPFGNVFFGDMMYQQNQNGQNQIQPIATGKMLTVAPAEAWIDAVEPSLKPALFTQVANLQLKVKAEKDAFPYIEKLAKTHPKEAKELAVRFIEVWGENHDPNADKRRTNRYMYIYGYNPQGDGIPLTRSRQERNLEELSDWVTKLRALPLGGLDESKIAAAFMRTHSSAEVYRMANIEKVFGGLEQMKAETYAAILQTMRQNLATVWRSPKEQMAKKTKRTDKEIMAEVRRGYELTGYMLDEGLKHFPADWKLHLVKAALMLDDINFRNLNQKDSSFSQEREAAFAEFKNAASMYAKALPALEQKDQSADVYLTWYYASLGAPDLEAVKPEQTPAPKQTALIRAAIQDLQGEAAERHETLFANSLSTRMTAAAPAVKHRYLSQGLPIAGGNERAREAQELFNYYADLVTEIKLDSKLDGPDVVGTTPFGVFINIRHTKQIEREAGGFQKYLQNQNNQQGFYNFGRPLENYRDKFEEAAREALKESFDVLSVTFHTDKIESRGDEEDGWRVTPYCYLLLKAKGPQTDALPSFKLNLDFMDTSGYAVLPIESAKIPLDASKAGSQRPARKLDVQEILDERKAAEGLLGLVIKASARGLVPGLEELFDLKPAQFDVVKIDDQGVRITQMDAGDEVEDEPADAVSERIWNVKLKAKPDLVVPATQFTFAKPQKAEIKVSYFRYADADLQEVSPEVNLTAKYGKTSLPWGWITTGLLTMIGALGIWIRNRSKRPLDVRGSLFSVPGEITPLSVIGLLQRIKQSGRLSASASEELDQTLAKMQQHYYAEKNDAQQPDLAVAAREWIQRVELAK